MKKRVLFIPMDALVDELFKIMAELTEETAAIAQAKAAMLSRLRAASRTGEVEWSE